MAKFFVGQRVRIVRTYGGGLLGREARIVALSVEGLSIEGPYIGHMLDIKNSYGCVAIAPPEDIEPILPSGAAPSEYSLAELLYGFRSVRVEA